jgi:hypothetical protein
VGLNVAGRSERAGRAQAAGRDAAERDPVGAGEDGQGGQRVGQLGHHPVAIDLPPAGGRRFAPREPALEVHVPDFQVARAAMRLRVDPADEMAVVEDGQGVECTRLARA